MTTPPEPPPYQPYGGPQPPYGQQQPYGQSPYGYPAPRPTNGLAIASLVVSVLSIVVCVGAPGFIGAILGHVARGQIRREQQEGGGLALAGVIVGWLGSALFVGMVVLFIALGVFVENSVDCSTDSSGTFSCD
ncbi:DUF4190 domain-containing protein [Pimelobacter simplex]|uniref:Uncharacterized protein n=1 Tax=Nocardioides simplex TaxID=2045 RepID=A0A0C5WYM0_NOCSI|nr:DUF4190 domain-containing protein [Pimelobacter simplex]AJR18398.1 hypothetical protein KR76_12955 [Pimelobacter simplex]MCG8149789.1 DUF4190 domain-containing protein [Pimelobacter simplex]GEB14003.1 hypothetical protein NSI01_23180 [Pimelobacter simplex]SFM65357.1 protein of unknown function [Pimelobacter simplex]